MKLTNFVGVSFRGYFKWNSINVIGSVGDFNLDEIWNRTYGIKGLEDWIVVVSDRFVTLHEYEYDI